MKTNRYKLMLFFLCVTLIAQAKVTLPSFFTDNMIVQQNAKLIIPGKTKAGKKVTIEASWDKQKHTVKADAKGAFLIEIPTPSAGGPYTITISDGNTLTLKNVMAGEVWFCSGQSNMEMPVAGWGKVLNYEKEIAEAQYPSIRLLQVKKKIAYSPQEDVEVNMNGWQECSPATVPEFSSVAYFYARTLWKELNVPIGVIDCTWGGTPAEAWTSISSLEQVMGFSGEAARMRQLDLDKDKLNAAYRQAAEEWMQLMINKDRGFSGGKPQWTSQLQTTADWKKMNLPGFWEDKGLNSFDGIVWFQKEVEIPAAWAGKDVKLNLGLIDDEDITYYNGVEIARGYGHTTPRNYTIPANLVKAGKGVITVRVTDTGGEGGINGDSKSLFVELNEQKISLVGEWTYQIGVSSDELPARPASPESASYPSVLYNGMVHALTIFPIKGAIWYQGEANVGREDQYKRLFATMISDWREQWKQEFPFYFVQLANFLERVEVQPESKWAALREAQAEALYLKNTGMAVSIDIGEARDIHPKNKQEVARRLALNALRKTYDKKNVVPSGPTYQGHQIIGKSLLLNFDQEVKIEGDTAKGFILAGPDGVFHPAIAIVRGREIILRSPHIKIPLAARYGWADNPECNLYGPEGLPVVPFRTDK